MDSDELKKLSMSNLRCFLVQKCEHRRAVEGPLRINFSAIPAQLDPLKPAMLSIGRVRWCFDCGAVLSGPPPSPLEELELCVLAIQVHGLNAAELRAADVAVCMRLAGGFFAGGKARR